jgi:glycosyltransferase involved in cell wall biosynthesis
MSNPILTIAIPTFNRGIWLDKSLDILQQELNMVSQQVEVIISNNASTDNTNLVISKHNTGNLFTFFEQESNIGAVKNITFLTEQAKGKYLWILGDDDFIYKGFLLCLLEILNGNSDCSLLFIEMAIWYPSISISDKHILEASIKDFYKTDYTIKKIKYEKHNKAAIIAEPSRGYFNAIGNIILLKKDYLKAFKIGASAGPEFTSIESTFPHAYYIALNLLDKPCIHVISPGTYCSHAVSWKKYYEITYLKWYPELFILMTKFGADVHKANEGRRSLFPRYVNMIPRVLMRKAGNYEYFSMLVFVKNNFKFLEFWTLPFKIALESLKYISRILFNLGKLFSL